MHNLHDFQTFGSGLAANLCSRMYSVFYCAACVRLPSNPIDLTGFLSPSKNSISQHVFLWSPCWKTMHLEGDACKIKTCYPLLGGILHVMTKDWLSTAFICYSEGITHCHDGEDIYICFMLFFFLKKQPFPLFLFFLKYIFISHFYWSQAKTGCSWLPLWQK